MQLSVRLEYGEIWCGRARMRHMMADSWWWADSKWNSQCVCACVCALHTVYYGNILNVAHSLQPKMPEKFPAKICFHRHFGDAEQFLENKFLFFPFNFVDRFARTSHFFSVRLFRLHYYIFIRVIIMPNRYSVSGPLVYNNNKNKIAAPGEMNTEQKRKIRNKKMILHTFVILIHFYSCHGNR